MAKKVSGFFAQHGPGGGATTAARTQRMANKRPPLRIYILSLQVEADSATPCVASLWRQPLHFFDLPFFFLDGSTSALLLFWEERQLILTLPDDLSASSGVRVFTRTHLDCSSR